MSSAKSFLFLFGIGAIAANVVVGCSSTSDPVGFAEPEEGGLEAALPETGGSQPLADGSAPIKPDAGTLPTADASSAPDADASTDASIPDAADAHAPDAAVADAGPPGSPCPTKDAIGQQACGLCGTQTRLCAPNNSNPGSPNVWQPWGFCQSEVADGCVPGTASTETCGLCGTRNRVCQSDCRYAVGACKNEPAGACKPGSVDYQVGLSCVAGGRSRTCQPTCTYGGFGNCFVPSEPSLTVAATAGAKVSGQFNLPDATTAPRLGDSCPTASLSGTSTSYGYVTLINPTASTVVVSVWSGKSTNAGATVIDTVVASYAGNTKPANDAARQACVKGVNDGCTDPAGDPTACLSSWAGLFDSDAVTIPPNGKALVYVAGYYTYSTGDYQLTARTDSLN